MALSADRSPFAFIADHPWAFGDEKGEAVLRAEYIWVAGKAYGMRSSPA